MHLQLMYVTGGISLILPMMHNVATRVSTWFHWLWCTLVLAPVQDQRQGSKCGAVGTRP